MRGLGVSMDWAVWVFQLTRGFGCFSALTVMCISVDLVRLGVSMGWVVWRASGFDGVWFFN